MTLMKILMTLAWLVMFVIFSPANVIDDCISIQIP